MMKKKKKMKTDTLRRAGVEVIVASVEETLSLKMSRGVVIVADALLVDIVDQDFDCIALPGGMPGANTLRDNLQLKEMILSFSSAGKLIGAICAAPGLYFVLFSM